MKVDFICTTPQAIPEPELAAVGHIQGREVKQVVQKDLNQRVNLLKAWEIALCAITVIGLLVLLGLYFCRKAQQIKAIENMPTTGNTVQDAEANSKPKETPPPALPVAMPALPVVQLPPDLYAELKLKKEIILNDNPQWASDVHSWGDLSLVNQVWVLQLFELRTIGIEFGAISKFQKSLPLNGDLPEIFKLKGDIDQQLRSIQEVVYTGKDLRKCPSSAIELLVNLKHLDLSGNLLKSPPDVKKNPNLEILNLGNNTLTHSPDVSNNPKLKFLALSGNLKEAPDVTKNPDLETLKLRNNHIKFPPDLSKNPKLKEVDCTNNLLTEAPDVSKNPELQTLILAVNQITQGPDLTVNLKLENVDLSFNKLAALPNISPNSKIQSFSANSNLNLRLPSTWGNYIDVKMLSLSSCGLREFPNFIQFTKPIKLDLDKNSLSDAAKKQIKDWAATVPDIRVKL